MRLTSLWVAGFVVAIIGCDGSGCGAGDVCPGPILGTGEISGQLIRSDGTPVRNQQVYSACYGVGVFDGPTDEQGRFLARFLYMSGDPPEDVASGEPFVRYCRVSIEEVVLRDSIPVTFYPDEGDVVPTEVQVTLDG